MDAGIVIGLVQLGVTVFGGFVLMPMKSDMKDLRDRDKEFVPKETYNKDHEAQQRVNGELFDRTRKVEIICAKNHGGSCK